MILAKLSLLHLITEKNIYRFYLIQVLHGYIAKTAPEKTGALIFSIKLFPSLEVALRLKKPTIQYSVKIPH